MTAITGEVVKVGGANQRCVCSATFVVQGPLMREIAGIFGISITPEKPCEMNASIII